MAELQKFKVEERKIKKGKGPNRSLRAMGMVPGIYYDANGGNIALKADFIALSKLVSSVGFSKVFELEIISEGKSETRPALIKALHHHPLKAIYNHVDFFGVDLAKKVIVSIPVHVTGKPKGVVAGGTLGIFREFIDVECLPKDIPDSLVLDVVELELGHNISIADVELGEGVQAIFDENFAVVGVVIPRVSDADDEEEKEEAEETPVAE